MAGVLEEALRGGPATETVKVVPSEHTVKTSDGAYTLTGYFSTVESGRKTHRYFNYTKVGRR